ncbi:MAG: hypothetical protein MUF49_24200 [Oculatellaceae cyanobacterium Prado106]|nr:hypothetical protein [Oculatellaceae cyanobacterium Prado106]
MPNYRDFEKALSRLGQARAIAEKLKNQSMLDRCKLAICRCHAARRSL